MEYTFTVNYEKIDSWDDLSKEDTMLIEKAYTSCEKAYSPYSKFSVGAAVLLHNNEIILGNNQENIAYPSGLCAERVALFYVGASFPHEKIKTICIVAKGDLLPFNKLLSPCGACRQVMIESETRQQTPFRVLLVAQNKQTIILNSAADLLPFAFGIAE
jgi:cytidine deaminase